MGADIHVKVVVRDPDFNTWRQVKLYHKDKNHIKFIEPYNARDYELFDILNGNEDDRYPVMSLSLAGLSSSLVKEITKCQKSLGFYGFKEVNLADLKLYLYDVPKVPNYEGENTMKDNPVKTFMSSIERYVDFAEPNRWCIPDSCVRILYWFDN